MVGCDLPSGGSGSPPSAVARPMKRKRGDAAAEDGAAPPRRATRKSAGLDVEGAVWWARRAAEGALWVEQGRNRGLDDEEEPMGAVILAMRHARSELKPDDPESPYAKVSVLGAFESLRPAYKGIDVRDEVYWRTCLLLFHGSVGNRDIAMARSYHHCMLPVLLGHGFSVVSTVCGARFEAIRMESDN